MDLSQIKIARYEEGQKIWMVRADSGQYLENFMFGSVISIKHLDIFYNFSDHDTKDIPSDEAIRKSILSKANYRDQNSKTPKLNGSGQRSYNQIMHFLHDIKRGDLIVSLDDNVVVIGVCRSSKAFFSKRGLNKPDPEGGSTTKLPHTLRKKVDWGPRIPRSRAAGLLRAPFQAVHTISRLDKHWKEVFSLIYPFFTDGESLYFSQFIGTREEINGKVISKLFSNLSNVQPLLDEMLNGVITNAFVDALVNDELELAWESFDLTTKAFFMSPGGISSKLPLPAGIAKELAAKVLAVLVLINIGLISAEAAAEQLDEGNSTSSIYTPGGMIKERDLKPSGEDNVGRMLGELVKGNAAQLEQIKKRQKAIKVKSKLKLTIPDYDTSVLEEKGGVKVSRID
ncbi:hypothetical protein [Pseudomonas sp. LG1E9]|uniref:hypothetical protein n=1 Tax=Pseudomonas sp. LG1E9 TaxID=2219057 RepID=UPI0013A70A2C|nr:hypothetical protein [Pseudomonas sp. LG1E9]